ncbi:hypothetical protein ATCV1_z268L [Acanthocystis turfacea chlorella virus 1]|uniref:Uncharacterized protein z268L n=1 Tax=Chlorovirus heliozoae TaxID=322019 RepID=A7K8M8_9PHYC|nr:hypothetical protein ATCV1_z268L [Acanthocystis turfacea chlorella virus 1]ABT16402.1 hypothetical protein ATCV1_z268L [Acanthocystis turfacea chlorella virus 1]
MTRSHRIFWEVAEAQTSAGTPRESPLEFQCKWGRILLCTCRFPWPIPRSPLRQALRLRRMTLPLVKFECHQQCWYHRHPRC